MIKNISSLILGRTITTGKLKVDIESENRDYKLFINGNFQKEINKNAGYMDSIVADSANEISLRIPGQGVEKEVYRNFITVKEGEVYALDYFPSGSLSVKTKPMSEIFINNVSSGKADINGELNLSNVRAGVSNLIRIENSGKVLGIKAINIEEGKNYELVFDAGKENTLTNVITNSIVTNTTVPSASAKTDDYVKGKMDGMIKGAKSGNGAWFFSGCLLSVIGLILPYMIDPTLPTEDLIGKSSSYVLGFTDGFNEKAKSANFNYALIGCGVGAAVGIIILII